MSETEEKAPVAQEEVAVDPALREMMDAGVFYGRSRNKTNPRMKQFVMANRNGVEIINLEKTKIQLEEAKKFLKGEAARGASMILLGTQPSAKEVLETLASEFKIPVVTRRWLGGTLTNYKVISKRVEYYKKLKADLAMGAFKSYTKKEQLDLEKESIKLTETLAGLENMISRPEVLLVIDPVVHKTAVAEANRLQIPVISLVNTDADPTLIDYAVTGNTKARTSISWFVNELSGVIRQGRSEKPVEATPAVTA